MTDQFPHKQHKQQHQDTLFLSESDPDSSTQIIQNEPIKNDETEVVPQENHSRTMLIFFCISITMLIIVVMSIKIFKYCKKKPLKDDQKSQLQQDTLFEQNNPQKDFETFNKLKRMERKLGQEHYLKEKVNGQKSKKSITSEKQASGRTRKSEKVTVASTTQGFVQNQSSVRRDQTHENANTRKECIANIDDNQFSFSNNNFRPDEFLPQNSQEEATLQDHSDTVSQNDVYFTLGQPNQQGQMTHEAKDQSQQENNNEQIEHIISRSSSATIDQFEVDQYEQKAITVNQIYEETKTV